MKIFDFGQSHRSIFWSKSTAQGADVTLGLTWQNEIWGRCVGAREAHDDNDPGMCERVVACDEAWLRVLVRQKL